MTSVWDDPDLRVSGDYVKFENPGDTVIGDILAIGKHTFPATADKPASTCAKLFLRLEDGTEKTLTAGQIGLASLLAEKRPAVGDRVKIVFVSTEKRPAGRTLKHFTLDVKPGTPIKPEEF